MIRTLDAADHQALAAFETIIDVRSPGEFAEDHVPGALNLPVLDDEERALVGTMYVQQSRFGARRLGAALVARNIAAHLEGDLALQGPDFAPLVYCWRGGQRSTAMATVFDQVGWRPTLLAGGYKTYRRAVCERLKTIAPRVVLLGGHTGTAKTAILLEARAMGAQVLDLEGLAHHRGSLLGEIAGEAQPSQKMFESRLAIELDSFDPARPLLAEAKSSKIGAINIPEVLWEAMRSAPAIDVRAPLEARAAYLTSAYRDLTSDPDRLHDMLSRLPSRLGRSAIAAWLEMARDGHFEPLAASLMEAHYDPAYARWNRNHPRLRLETIDLDDMSQSSIRQAAARVVGRLDGNLDAHLHHPAGGYGEDVAGVGRVAAERDEQQVLQPPQAMTRGSARSCAARGSRT